MMTHLRHKEFFIIGSIDELQRSVQVTASTESIDSYGEVVEQSWRLERYARNPVVLFAHNSKELPIGYASNVRVVDGALRATITFVTASASERAEQVWQSLKQGSIRGVSVGFMPGSVREEERNGRSVIVLSDNELFEISIVAVPANADGLARSKDAALTCPKGMQPKFGHSKLLDGARAAARQASGENSTERAFAKQAILSARSATVQGAAATPAAVSRQKSAPSKLLSKARDEARKACGE